MIPVTTETLNLSWDLLIWKTKPRQKQNIASSSQPFWTYSCLCKVKYTNEQFWVLHRFTCFSFLNCCLSHKRIAVVRIIFPSFRSFWFSSTTSSIIIFSTKMSFPSLSSVCVSLWRTRGLRRPSCRRFAVGHLRVQSKKVQLPLDQCFVLLYNIPNCFPHLGLLWVVSGCHVILLQKDSTGKHSDQMEMIPTIEI